MSDKWQSPGGEVPPVPPVPQPSAGYYIAPETPPQPSGAQPQPGWTPPPKPGLIPLRPLELGAILGGSFRVLKNNPRPTLGASLLIQGVVYLLVIGVVAAVAFFTTSRIETSSAEDADTIAAGSVGLVVLASIVPLLVAVAAAALLQGIVVLEVARGTVGEKSTFRQLWGMARGRVMALIGWTLLLGLAALVVIGVLAGLIALLVLTLGTMGIVLGVLLGIFGGLGLLVIYFWIGTRVSLVPSAIMVERLGIRAAVVRSWTLTHGYFWRTLGIQLLISTILGFATQAISFVVGIAGGLLVALLDPNGQNSTTTGLVLIGLGILTLVITVAFAAITAVVQSSAIGLIYIDLRMRKEGLDLELARFVEARQAGDTTVTDPYLRAP